MNAAQRRFCVVVAFGFITFGAYLLYGAITATASALKGATNIAVLTGALFFSLGLALVYLGFFVGRKNTGGHVSPKFSAADNIYAERGVRPRSANWESSPSRIPSTMRLPYTQRNAQSRGFPRNRKAHL